jgi:hypothetical protein
VAGSCEDGNELLGSTKAREFSDYASDSVSEEGLCSRFVGAVGLKATTYEANPDAKRLYDDLLSNYNRLIRPVSNNSDTLTVWLGLKLSQLIEVVSTVRTLKEFHLKVFVSRSSVDLHCQQYNFLFDITISNSEEE